MQQFSLADTHRCLEIVVLRFAMVHGNAQPYEGATCDLSCLFECHRVSSILPQKGRLPQHPASSMRHMHALQLAVSVRVFVLHPMQPTALPAAPG